jgi:hypothetical protein
MHTANDDALAAILTDPELVAGPTGNAGGRRCQLGRALDTVNAGNRAAILEHLHGATADKALAKMLRAGGVKTSAAALSDHRRQVCICDTFADDELDQGAA